MEWTSNADASPGGGSAIRFGDHPAPAGASSDWARHAASFSAYGTWQKSVSGSPVSEFDAGADASLRLDLDDDYTFNAAASYTRAPESASSPIEIPSVAERPIRQTLDASLGLDKAVGKLRLTLTGAVSRDIYGAAQLTDGSMLSQSDRNDTLASVTLRGGYQVSPAVTPFVETTYGRLLYDQTLNSAGYARSGNQMGRTRRRRARLR